MRELTTHTIELDFPSMSPHRVGRYEVTILGEDVNPPRGYVGPGYYDRLIVGCRPVEHTLCWGDRETTLAGDDAEYWSPVLDTQPGGADEERVLMACNLI
jgi:hypothetical protein